MNTTFNTTASSSIAQTLPALEATQYRLNKLCEAGTQPRTKEQLAAAILLICAANVMAKLESAQGAMHAVESGASSSQAVLRGCSATSFSRALSTYVPVLEYVIATFQGQAEAALATTNMDLDADNINAMSIYGILPDLTVCLSHVINPAQLDNDALAADSIVVTNCSLLGLELGEFIWNEPGTFNLFARDVRAQVPARVALQADKTLPQDQAIRGYLFAVGATIEALKHIQQACREPVQHLLAQRY